jgi:3-carboxy-cis,cis-muconate cycloisomerase
MPTTVFDSDIFRDSFGTPAMRAVFSDARFLAQATTVEIALARVQGRLGLIPEAAADEIAARADPTALDLAGLKSETDVVGYPIVGLVHQLGAMCGDAGRYLHWGATTQDIMDTATVLQVRTGLALVEEEMRAIDAALAGLARTHRATVMAGRTHLQHALPITFGLKAAVWLAAHRRHRERLAQLRPRVLVGQLAGAAGTLASLGDKGLAVSDALMRELGLGRPPIAWHAARDGFAETVGFLGLLTASLAKIATDVMLLMQTEVGEAFEPFVTGRGSSSTMPQKRNPISCELIIAAAKTVRQQAGLMLDAMVTDHERATGPWHAEWIALPQAFLAGASALHQARTMLEGLVVEPARMRRNLEASGGLIVSEAVMMALAPALGRQKAHDVVYRACRAAADGRLSLLEALAQDGEVTAALDRGRLAALVDPANYLGAAPEMIDRVLEGR